MSNANLGKQAWREPLQYKKAQNVKELRGICAAQTWAELFQQCQAMWDYPVGSYERNIIYSAYMLRLRELQEKFHFNPDHKEFKITKDDGRGNSAWREEWN